MLNFIQALPLVAAKPPTKGMNILMIVMIIGMFAMLFISSRREKKRSEQIEQMRENLKLGDEVMTSGGILGKVVTVRDDDSVIIETGADRIKLCLTKRAIVTNITKEKEMAKEKAEAKKAKATKNSTKSEKPEKKN
ncbi:MAG: preprotein translocase subunit YajC [Clostridia bacterium]|nr:preprotein translocase subunit YajC [Clostridia bacterium]